MYECWLHDDSNEMWKFDIITNFAKYWCGDTCMINGINTITVIE